MNHKTQTQVMMKSFERAAAGLLTVTERDLEQYEKGHFGKFFAKPSQRLASLLAVEREVLVVFSTLQEQQVRTVQALKDFIEREDGRLQSTIAIVIHCDSAGSSKPKRWGRTDACLA